MSLTPGAWALLAGAVMTAIASLAHLACIVAGAPAYRLMGAGERMARAAEAGQAFPTVATLGIAAVLAAWAAYGLAGARVIPELPLTRIALFAIGAVFLGRALCFPLLRSSFPENSDLFWWVSSAICGVMGLLYLYCAVAR